MTVVLIYLAAGLLLLTILSALEWRRLILAAGNLLTELFR